MLLCVSSHRNGHTQQQHALYRAHNARPHRNADILAGGTVIMHGFSNAAAARAAGWRRRRRRGGEVADASQLRAIAHAHVHIRYSLTLAQTHTGIAICASVLYSVIMRNASGCVCCADETYVYYIQHTFESVCPELAKH